MLKNIPTVVQVIAALVIAGAGVFVALAATNSSALPDWATFWKDDPYEFNGGFYEPPREGFQLINAVDHNGKPFSLEDHRGKVIFVYFGYTWCPDACPATLANWREVKALLGDKVDDVVFVMVTVDPERDSPARLKEWMAFWDTDFYGVVMSPEDTETMTNKYGIKHSKRDGGSASGYLVDHDVTTYVMDPEGRLRLSFPLNFPPEDIVEDTEHLLAGD